MKKLFLFALVAFIAFGTMSCSENYSKGERIGFVNKFSEKGLIWKSYEGELNLTQTGMNSSTVFDFSVDNDRPDENVIKTLDSAAINGWKVKVKYHETFGWNWFGNRGHTDYFAIGVEVLDKNMVNNIKELTNGNGGKVTSTSGKDTIYVIVIDPKDIKKYLPK